MTVVFSEQTVNYRLSQSIIRYMPIRSLWTQYTYTVAVQLSLLIWQPQTMVRIDNAPFYSYNTPEDLERDLGHPATIALHQSGSTKSQFVFNFIRENWIFYQYLSFGIMFIFDMCLCI